MNTSFAWLLPSLAVAAIFSLTLSSQCVAQELGRTTLKSKTLVIDTHAATLEGIKFKQDGAQAINALPFDDPALRSAALVSFTEFMKPPVKKTFLAITVPGTQGVIMRFNPHSGQFAQLMVTSDAAKTTEGLGVGSQFEDFVALYGPPAVRLYPNNAVTYSFSTPNPSLSIVLRDNTSPVKHFMMAYDLKRG